MTLRDERVRRQTTIGEVDAPAIEELAAGHDRDEHRRLTVLGDADGRGSLRSSFRHVFLLPPFTHSGQRTSRIATALHVTEHRHQGSAQYASRRGPDRTPVRTSQNFLVKDRLECRYSADDD